jgi:TonB family protein
MELIKDKNSRKGLMATILFHLVLFLLFLFVGMAYPDPPPPEEGITINFGTSDEGMGEEQPENPSETSENVEQENTETTTTASSNIAEEQVVTQNTTETINVNASENTTQESETVVEEESTSQNLSEALNAFNNNSSSSNANEGETGNPGDQGSLDGDPNSSNHTGGGVGNGVSYSLAGRNLLSTPKIDDNSQEQGKVVVDIVVDKTGKVIKATPGGRGSTTTSPLLYKKALEAALKTKFNAKPDLVGDQKGQMTFVFILN